MHMTGPNSYLPTGSSVAGPEELHAGAAVKELDVDRVVAIELLEATLSRLRGHRAPCYPSGEQTLLAAAQTLLEAARSQPPTAAAGTNTATSWAHAWRQYLRELGRVAAPETWPTTNALSQVSKDRLCVELYPDRVATFRTRDHYAWVPLADLPAPLNPFRCGHYQQFEQFLSRRERQRRRTARAKQRWLRSLASGSADVDPHEPRRLAGADFASWLRETAAPLCDWHRTDTDWHQAMTWARRCWDAPELTWTESAVRSWIDSYVPLEVRAATTSMFCDPIIWAGPGWDLGNGQTRYLALNGAGVTNVIVSRG